MEIFLIRHAKAIEADAEAGPLGDARRSLTARGRRDAREVGLGLRASGVRLDAIVMSPLVRAVETAELIAVGLDFEGGLEVASELALGGRAGQLVADVILPRSDLDAIALVGHEPQLGQLLSQLLGVATYGLAKCAAVRLHFEGVDRPSRFSWVLRPGMKKPSRELSDVI